MQWSRGGGHLTCSTLVGVTIEYGQVFEEYLLLWWVINQSILFTYMLNKARDKNGSSLNRLVRITCRGWSGGDIRNGS